MIGDSVVADASGHTERTSNDLAVDARRMSTNPADFFGHSFYASQHLDSQRLAAIQLAALQMRFAELRDRIPVLTAMADAAGITKIDTIDDVVPLLFPHSVYKSYPGALLDRGRFDLITRWLDRLTTVDITGVDVSGCDSIDAWLDVLDAETELRVVHSTGTTGTMSFLPRSASEYDRMIRSMRPGLFQFSDPRNERDHTEDFFNVVWPTFRRGRSAFMRGSDLFMRYYAGQEDRFHALYPGRLSADAMLFAGKQRAAAARGEQLQITPALRARRAEFERAQREMTEALPRFFADVIEKMRDQRVWIFGTWNVMFDIAREGQQRAITQLFARDSVVTTGGGAKGAVVDDDWQEQVIRFTGIDHIQHVYGMTELTAMNKACAQGEYHLEPWIIPFLLDPDEGTLYPREGIHTGRAAFFDLMAETCWGGTISGDEVTIDWSPCQCGQTTVHLGPKVERFSDKRGGDDKISCSGAEEAHRSALSTLTGGLA